MTNAQTEARAIAQTSLWVPAKPEHAKIGWTYDFEQTERISRAAYDSTGYDATMEVVEFVMAEADRRHATALAAKNAELAAKEEARAEQWRLRREAEASRDVARAACDAMRIERDEALSSQDDGLAWDALSLCKSRAKRAESQLAEASRKIAEKNKALDRIIALDSNIDATPRGNRQVIYGPLAQIARLALEAQGGENG